MNGDLKVALVGNPNTGKSTLFNVLTGLRQKIGNFPGVTVDKKVGFFRLPDGRNVQLLDLPGTYSLYPKSKDEMIVFEVLADKKHPVHPDLVIIIADASNLKRNLLLYTQLADLKIPVIIALNMMDMARKGGIDIDVNELSKRLGVQVVPISARQEENIDKLKEAISNASSVALQIDTIEVEALAPELISQIKHELGIANSYAALQIAHQHQNIHFLTARQSQRISELLDQSLFHSQKLQAEETIARYSFINDVLFDAVTIRKEEVIKESISNRIDEVLTHRIWGFTIFFGILFLIFQAIFAWSEFPMTLIENFFVWAAGISRTWLPSGVLADLLIDGVLAGLGGVLIFIPQIAILFAFISILEDTGYMARVTFMMDRIMKKVGLSGKSVVPMIGSLACAVPSIMSTRNIESWKDRIITIMVTPLVSCSARLPVYTLLISLVVPDTKVWGLINMQGLAMMGMYLIGFVSAILVAWIMKQVIRSRERGYFIMELPVYRIPRWSNVALTMYEKVKTFVFEAGKVIIAVSIVLWVLATYGPPGRQAAAQQQYLSQDYVQKYSAEEIQNLQSSAKLENSYAGILGKLIEPSIKPLGFDWKIGIALITSFAAREVFVGTMATIYSVNGDDQQSVRQKMSRARNDTTGQPVFTVAVAWSLMLFYAFAMQCMSTVAIVYRETKSWKWPVIQIVYMTGMAYLASLIVYQILK